MPKDAEISKALSHALRHEPWLYELELDDDGWVALDALLHALRGQNDDWRALSVKDLERVVESTAKRRHEVDGTRIRAIYGHSVPGKLRRESATPPALLFHGTTPDAADQILRNGLLPMSRQYVHLSVDVGMARDVGSRKSRVPTLLEIDARAAHDSGFPFYFGNEHVWLADVVPARFLFPSHPRHVL